MNRTVVTKCQIHFLEKPLDISLNTESLLNVVNRFLGTVT